MKIQHNLNGWSPDKTDPRWAEREEAEAQRTTDATEARARKLAERIQRAEVRMELAAAKLEEARSRYVRKAVLKRLTQDVEERRQELIALHREMTASPAGSQHRGKGSYRPVPNQATPL